METPYHPGDGSGNFDRGALDAAFDKVWTRGGRADFGRLGGVVETIADYTKSDIVGKAGDLKPQNAEMFGLTDKGSALIVALTASVTGVHEPQSAEAEQRLRDLGAATREVGERYETTEERNRTKVAEVHEILEANQRNAPNRLTN